MQQIKTKKLYTIREVADILRVDPQTVRRYIKEGKFKVIKYNARTFRIPAEEIKFLFTQEQDPQGEDYERLIDVDTDLSVK